MKYIKAIDLKMDNVCVAFGDFDGIHCGHRAIIDKLLEISKQGLTSVIVSFEYDETLLKERKILTTATEKEYLLSKNGPDVLIPYRIDEQNKEVPIRSFIKEMLIDRLGAKVIVAGACDNNIEVLRECAKMYDYTLVECDTVLMDGELVTSSRIIKELAEGSLQKANELLGHPYLFIGTVMHGKARGRTVGLPTANLSYVSYKQLPAHGVFGTLSEIDGKIIKGLTNIGKRPSDDDYNYISVETFLLDFSEDLYDKTITLEIHVHIRGVIKFNSLEEVKLQVDKDIVSIKTFLEKYS